MKPYMKLCGVKIINSREILIVSVEFHWGGMPPNDLLFAGVPNSWSPSYIL